MPKPVGNLSAISLVACGKYLGLCVRWYKAIPRSWRPEGRAFRGFEDFCSSDSCLAAAVVRFVSSLVLKPLNNKISFRSLCSEVGELNLKP